ncbi:DUF6247 family protein [Actinopolymorpha sp. B9G3]|uniref:DUF6247 family protein n=1 Tax=Actinopolymorpha sp. B9G3 TaxID=3158970 RepID=UPI0032D91957
MTAQPSDYHDSYDPEKIMHKLPQRERERFLREYRQAAEAAAHEIWRYKELTALLHRWSLIALAVSAPGYYEAREDAGRGIGEYMTLEGAIARRQRKS